MSNLGARFASRFVRTAYPSRNSGLFLEHPNTRLSITTGSGERVPVDVALRKGNACTRQRGAREAGSRGDGEPVFDAAQKCPTVGSNNFNRHPGQTAPPGCPSRVHALTLARAFARCRRYALAGPDRAPLDKAHALARVKGKRARLLPSETEGEGFRGERGHARPQGTRGVFAEYRHESQASVR